MRVSLHRLAAIELDALPESEQDAIGHAIEKLEAYGPLLPFPHQSVVKGAADLRELRPRSGRSRWRAFYRRVGNTLWIGAIGPEANVSPQGFRRAISAAEERLSPLDSATERG
ncbi:MAG: type II toxin-antitoxin system RelE/ParE family toxin [Chloroflexota bacterium]